MNGLKRSRPTPIPEPDGLAARSRAFARVTFVWILLCCTPGAAWAGKINAAYINNQPHPLGELTLKTAQRYGTTMFTRFNIMGLTFGDCGTANPIQWGGQPVLTADWKVPAKNQDALGVIQALKAKSGAEVYVSLVGSGTSDCLGGLSSITVAADPFVCGPGGKGVGSIQCAVFYLDLFLSAYGIDGLDIDLEGGDPSGFTNLLQGIEGNSEFLSDYRLSFAPFEDGDRYSAVYLQGGACAFQDNGIKSFVAGRQYYSGGTIGNPQDLTTDSVAQFLKSELNPPNPVQCENSGTLKLDASNLVLGLSPYSVLGDQFPHVRGYPNTCQYYYQRENPDCAETVEKVIAMFPALAGAFVWTIELIDPVYYSCYIGNALNQTNNDCGEPQPIPGDAGFCGPTQPPTCTHPNAQNYQAGPIRNEQEARAKCPPVCVEVGLEWTGQWSTTVPGKMSVCGCNPISKQTSGS